MIKKIHLSNEYTNLITRITIKSVVHLYFLHDEHFLYYSNYLLTLLVLSIYLLEIIKLRL